MINKKKAIDLRDKLINLIDNIILKEFYGVIEIKFEKGVITICRKSETIKL